MKILYLAAAWPSKKTQYIGSPFFQKRINLLPKNIDFDVYSILPRESLLIKTIRLLVPKYNRNPLIVKSELPCENFTWKFLHYKESFFAKYNHKKNIASKVEVILAEAEKIPNLHNYTLIHAQYSTPNGLVAYRLKQKFGIPYVIKAHGSDIHTFPFKDKMLKKLTIQALENADRVIFVSNWLLNKAKSLGYSKDNYVVISNGIDPVNFKPLNKQAIKDELKLGSKTVGFVGSLIPVKRVDKFAEMFAMIHKRCADVQFLIVGTGYLRDKLEKALKLQGIDATFTGQILPDKVPFYINAMNVMILPSRNEGWPCVVLEAHACGVPVLGSNNGGIPEAIDNNNFIIPDNADFESKFADKVCEILENPPSDTNKLIERAQEFTWRSIVDREIAIYEEINMQNRS